MALDSNASAVDGATLTSSLLRRAQFAGTSGAQGVVGAGHFRVHELAVPGQGLRVDAGVALVLNDYQGAPTETYVCSNPSTHTVTSLEMPASNPAAKAYIVAVVVGDPDFSQVGHPWMGASDPPVGQEATFEYVRLTLIECGANDTSLDVSYPALPLARLNIPANTTTVTDAMITDLRALALPRQSQTMMVSPVGTWTNGAPRLIPAGADFHDWGAVEYAPSVAVPEWATRAILVVTINGVLARDTSVNLAGQVRTQFGAVSGPETAFDFESGGGKQRATLQTAGEYDVTSLAGTVANLRVEGKQTSPGSPTDDQRLQLKFGSQMVFDVRFYEE